MLILLCLLCVTFVASRLVCERKQPDQALLDRISLCRDLRYAACVDQRHAVVFLEYSELVVEADQSLLAQYQDIARTQSQRCVHAWINAACSATFPRLTADNVEPTVCPAVCAAVRKHCIGVPCEPATLERAPHCTDFYALSNIEGEVCAVVAQDDNAGPSPIPPPSSPPRRVGGGGAAPFAVAVTLKPSLAIFAISIFGRFVG